MSFGVFRLHVDADPSENARQRLDIGLRVAGADAHGVQLHDLTGVVLIEMAGRVIGVVEIAQYSRMDEIVSYSTLNTRSSYSAPPIGCSSSRKIRTVFDEIQAFFSLCDFQASTTVK